MLGRLAIGPDSAWETPFNAQINCLVTRPILVAFACASGEREYVGPVEICTTVSGAFAQVLTIIGWENGSIAYEPKA